MAGFLDGLIQAVPQLANLVKKGDEFAAAHPDFAPGWEKLKAEANASSTAENLAAVAGFLKTEIANVAQLKFDGRDHPSDDM